MDQRTDQRTDVVCVVGSVNADVVVICDRLPTPGETVAGRSVDLLDGGKGANQVVAATRAGAATRFIGAIGADDAGERLRRSLVAEGVDVSHIGVVDGPSGTALIQVDASGENTIIVVPGANGRIDPTLVSAAGNAGAFEGARVVLCQLEIPADAVVAAFAAGRAIGAATILNATPAGGVDPRLLTLTDVLVVNETELLEIAGERDVELSIDLLSAKVPALVVTLGANGAVVVEAEHRTAVPSPPAAAIDTVGVGDACCGAIAAALAEGRVLIDAVRRGVIAGSIAVTRSGARSAPTGAEIDEMSLRWSPTGP